MNCHQQNQKQHHHHHHEDNDDDDFNNDVREKAADLILQDVCTSLTQNLRMQSINSYQHLSSQYIEQIVEIEMKRLKVNCSQEEENYVEQMLLENPIIVERRKTPTPPSPAPSQPIPPATQTSSATNCKNVTNNYGHTNTPNVPDSLQSTAANSSGNDEETVIQLQQHQQQRSESCRRSRINNKIKKAKAKYRHKFMSEKLLQSANVLECLQKLIEQTENQLINQGFNALQLLELRKLFYNNFMAAE